MRRILLDQIVGMGDDDVALDPDHPRPTGKPIWLETEEPEVCHVK